MKSKNPIHTYKLILKGVIICFVLSLAASNSLAVELPKPEKTENLEELLADDNNNDKPQQKSTWQWFKGLFGFGTEDTKEKHKSPEQNDTNPNKDIPDLPSIDKLTKEPETKISDDSIISFSNIDIKPDAEVPGKNDTLQNQDFSKPQELDVNDLFAEFADDALDRNEKVANDALNATNKKIDEITTAETTEPAKVTQPPTADVTETPSLDKILKQNSANLAREAIKSANNNTTDDDLNPNDDSKTLASDLTQLSINSLAPADQQNNEDINEFEGEQPYSQEDLSEEDKPLLTEDNDKSNQQKKIENFRDQIKQKLATKEKLPQIPEKQLAKVATDDSSNLSQELDNRQLRFVNNEAQVLVLPNDDIVLGKLTEEAKIADMDFRSYVALFWENYERVKDADTRASLDRFISKYDENFNTEKFSHTLKEDLFGLESANKSIELGRYNDLKVLLDNYAILQLTSSGGNTMLHNAAREGNYPAAKLLLMRGIDMRAINNRGESSMTIAQKYHYKHIIFLLNTAGYDKK